MMTNWSRDGPRLQSDNLRRDCRLQDRRALQGHSESRQHVVTHRRGRREAQLARSGIRKHEASCPAGTRHGGISMAGGQQGRGARMGDGVRGHCLPSLPCIF